MATGFGPSSQIWLMHMVDPSTFWFVNGEENDLRNDIEANLTAVLRRQQSFGSTTHWVPVPGQRVAVKDAVTLGWQRGEVQHNFAGLCLVFLLDHGVVRQVASRFVLPMPPDQEFLSEPCATRIQLRGVAPATTFVFPDCPPQVMEARKWDPSAFSFVTDLLAQATSAHLLTDVSSYDLVGDLLIGQVVLMVDSQYVKLDELLIANNYAMESSHWNERAIAYQLDPLSLQLGPNVTDPQQVSSPMAKGISQWEEDSDDCVGIAISNKNRSLEDGGGDTFRSKASDDFVDVTMSSKDRSLKDGGHDPPRTSPRDGTLYTFIPAGVNMCDYLHKPAKSSSTVASRSCVEGARVDNTPVVVFSSTVSEPRVDPRLVASSGIVGRAATVASHRGDGGAGEQPTSPEDADAYSSSSMLTKQINQTLNTALGAKIQDTEAGQQIVLPPQNVCSPNPQPVPPPAQQVLLPSSVRPQMVSSPPNVGSPNCDFAPVQSKLDKHTLMLQRRFNLKPAQDTVTFVKSTCDATAPSPQIVSPPVTVRSPCQQLVPPPLNVPSPRPQFVTPLSNDHPQMVSSPPSIGVPHLDVAPVQSKLDKRSLMLQRRFNLKSIASETTAQERESRQASQERASNSPASSTVDKSPEKFLKSALDSDLPQCVPVPASGAADPEDKEAALDQVAEGEMWPSQRHHPRSQRAVACIMDIMDKTRVLVHGKPVSKLNEVASARFPMVIHKGLVAMGVQALKPLQCYAWPAIFQGDNVVMVNPRGGGKTLGYLVPLLSHLLDTSQYCQFVKKSNGPFALILCSGVRSCELVYDMCRTLLGGVKSLKVLLTHGGGAELERKTALTNGCDVLISTPHCFLRLLCYSKYLVNLHRLCHLVLDEADVLLDKFLPQVKAVLASSQTAVSHRSVEMNRLQLVVASELWSTQLYAAVHAVTPDPLVLIGSYLEAAIYAHIRPKLEILKKANKLETVWGILSGTKGLYKTVIVCEDKHTAVPLHKYLQLQIPDVQFLLIHEDILGSEIQDVRAQWMCGREGDYPVLVCTDAAILQDMTISDARLLIHYNLPTKKTPFGARFTLLMDSYPDIHVKAGALPDCMVHILADEDNLVQLPGIVDLMRRLGATILPIVEETTLALTLDREASKTNLPLCYNVQAFGKCWDAKSCPNRHVVIAADRPVDLPTRGRVKLKMASVLDTCCFAARLLEVTYEDGTTDVRLDDYVSLAMEMALHFCSASDEPQVHGTVRLGDVCALEVTPGLFERAQVLEVTAVDKYEQPTEVTVLMMDSGVEKRRVMPISLKALPERLQEVAPQVVTVFLCCLMPGDNDLNYSAVSYEKVLRWISEADAQEEDGTFMVGDIRLALGHTLWLDPLHIQRTLRSVDTDVVGVALRRQLLRDSMVVDNPKHLDSLYQLCRAAGITDFPCTGLVDKAPKLSPPHSGLPTAVPLPSPHWAYLPTSTSRPLVIMSAADHPGLVFVRRHDLQPSLDQLTRDLQRYVAGRGAMEADRQLVIVEGALCLGRSEQDGQWNRAQVLSVTDEGQVELFFVDYGDRAIVSVLDGVTSILPRFVTTLPFQAIECSLFGLAPSEAGDLWLEEAVDLLYDLTVVESDGTARLFDYEIYMTDSSATCTGGRRYALALVDPFTTTDAVINRVLLDAHVALPVEDEVSFLEELPRTVVATPMPDVAPFLHVDDQEEEIIRLADLKGKRANAMNETDDLVLEEGETCFDVEIDDLQLFIFNMINGRNKHAAQQLKALNSLSAPPQLPALCAAPPQPPAPPQVPALCAAPVKKPCLQTAGSGLSQSQPQMVANADGQPNVVWYQKMEEVHLSIETVDVLTYQLQTDVMTLSLKTTEADGRSRNVTMDLFGAIDPRCTEHHNTGRRIAVKMIKLYTGFWPHLLQNPDKCYYWLRYDIDHPVDLEGYSLSCPEDGEFDRELVEERTRAALAASGSGGRGVAIANKDDIQPDFQYNDSESDSDNSNFAGEDRPYEHVDVHDPLSF